MNFRFRIYLIPALTPTTPPDGYLNSFNQIWLGYDGALLGDLQSWKWMVAIHPEDVAGSRSLGLVYPGIAQIVDFAIE